MANIFGLMFILTMFIVIVMAFKKSIVWGLITFFLPVVSHLIFALINPTKWTIIFVVTEFISLFAYGALTGTAISLW
jgi:hypothetical protein